MNEHLLHFIWKYKLFDTAKLTTVYGEPVEIVHGGQHNTHSGADFQNAKIKIGGVLWAGNIEMHLNASDWMKHNHQLDAAYNNVILHVVYNNDVAAIKQNGDKVAVLELKNRLNPHTLSRYKQLSERKQSIPCAKLLTQVDDISVKAWLDRLMVERLESKVAQVQSLLAENANDWESLMFGMVARYLGASINKEPFYLLAKSLPVKIWARHADDPVQIEALVFGQAGFLEEKQEDDYAARLRKEYVYLKRLHQLQPLPAHTWKFLRLRPANFPTIRLAQLAALMSHDTKFFSRILDVRNVKDIHEWLDISASDYWKTHFHFGKQSKNIGVGLGSAMKNVLLINAVAPVLFAYGKYRGSEKHCDKALALLELCKPEGNSIVTGWKGLGFKPINAYDTQALIQLKNEHCDKFDCLNCAIGHKILS